MYPGILWSTYLCLVRIQDTMTLISSDTSESYHRVELSLNVEVRFAGKQSTNLLYYFGDHGVHLDCGITSIKKSQPKCSFLLEFGTYHFYL